MVTSFVRSSPHPLLTASDSEGSEQVGDAADAQCGKAAPEQMNATTGRMVVASVSR